MSSPARFGKRARLLAVLVGAAVVAGGLVAASQLGSDDPVDTPAAPASAAAPDLFEGVPQRGAALGDPAAPVTLVEYADLQCPYCAEWAKRTLPVLVADYVSTGDLRIVFRGMAFLGPDSEAALRTVVSAGRQDRLWNVLHGLFVRQGPENSGWVSETLISEVAHAVPGADPDELLAERDSPWVGAAIERDAAAAQAAGVRGTPSFELGPTGGRLELVALRSLGPEGLRPAIDASLAR